MLFKGKPSPLMQYQLKLLGASWVISLFFIHYILFLKTQRQILVAQWLHYTKMQEDQQIQEHFTLKH